MVAVERVCRLTSVYLLERSSPEHVARVHAGRFDAPLFDPVGERLVDLLLVRRAFVPPRVSISSGRAT